MDKQLLSLADVSAQTGIRRHRISYALIAGVLREPKRLGNTRCFSPDDVVRIRDHFAGRAARRCVNRDHTPPAGTEEAQQ